MELYQFTIRNGLRPAALTQFQLKNLDAPKLSGFISVSDFSLNAITLLLTYVVLMVSYTSLSVYFVGTVIYLYLKSLLQTIK